ncbi:PAPS reductase-like domain protein [Gordonia phage VanLee]|uniref:PAPS reductase-like domain protein n=1 Tax=Gordonia phage VanLee TaxID=2845816 RepID=A0A8F2D9L6_9CAUD|nr:PAPS reductase-like domain protein [Gordonia phage VanLee]QWS68280.1 PAPS reductase-like domain protein [Gordonia phage VanLee]
MLELQGVPPSAKLLDDLEAEGRPIILNFSRGKDSLALWGELGERDIEVIPVHKSMIPGLKFVEDDLKRYEDHFQVKIHDVVDDSFYRLLANNIDQPPERCALLESCRFPTPTKEDLDKIVRDAFAEPDTWMLDGVRATDSAMRRMAITKHGPVNHRTRRMHAIWDFHIDDVRTSIKKTGIELGIDYTWWKHSFDGLWIQYLEKIKEHAPEDYETCLFWFPMVDTELIRGGYSA